MATNLNDIFNGSFIVNGNIIIAVSDASAVALNVSNGTIRGNGSQLFSINALSLLGTANNSQLQNTTITIVAANGLFSNAATISLGAAATFNVNVIDSITSTATNLPGSANSLRWAMIAANANTSNASLVTTYVVPEERGGTGKDTYLPGQLLIGNTLSGKLDKGNIIAGSGISVTSGANGSVTISANLIQGPGMLLQSSGNSGITISSNAYPDGNTTVEGIVRLYDAADSTSTSLAVTPNAVNAVVLTLNSIPSKNAYGRLLSRQVFTTSNLAGISGQESGTTYTWTKPAGTEYINIMIISGGGAGGSSQNVWNASETLWTPKVIFPNNAINRLKTAAFWGAPGESGSTAYWTGPASFFGSNITLFVGGGGTTRSGGLGNGADSWIANTGFIRVPGAPQTNNFISNVTFERAQARFGEPFTGRTGLGGSTAEQIEQGQLFSPFSDMGGTTDPLAYGFQILNDANAYRNVDQWAGFVKGANTLPRDAGTYTDNPSNWDAFKGISRGGVDEPALGLPWRGRAGGLMVNQEINKIWPYYGGKGGSTAYGRGGYGGTILSDQPTRITTQYPFDDQQNDKPDEFTRVSGYISPGTNFNNDLWYSFGGVNSSGTDFSARAYCTNTAGVSAATDDVPIAYGEAPHILSITHGKEEREIGNTIVIPLPETEVGDRLILSLGCYIVNTGTTPNGWSLVSGTTLLASPSTNTSLYPTLYRDITGTEGGNVSVGVSFSGGSANSRYVWTFFRIAKGTYDLGSAPVGTRQAETGAVGFITPPRELNLNSVIPSSWGRTTNTMLYITTWAGHVPNAANNLGTYGYEPIPPTTLELSYGINYTTNTSVGRNIGMGYGLKIRKTRNSWRGEIVTNAVPRQFDYPSELSASVGNVWRPYGTYKVGVGTITGDPEYWNKSFVASTSGSTLQMTTFVIRGNTSAPWTLKSAPLPINYQLVTDISGATIGALQTGVWYYKFQHGQDATGYGAGGGGAIKGTGNAPWDGKSWQVHGGNGASGLIIVEAYSSGNSIFESA